MAAKEKHKRRKRKSSPESGSSGKPPLDQGSTPPSDALPAQEVQDPVAPTGNKPETPDLKLEVETYKDLAQRATAELLNLQKRLRSEKIKASKLAVRDTIQALLPCFDNLERALQMEDKQNSESVIDGVRMVHEEIQRVLQERGLSVVDPKRGTLLDPSFHEAVLNRPEKGFEEGTILEVFEKGYRLGELIIRPARVIVAAAPCDPETPASDAESSKDAAPSQQESNQSVKTE